MDKINDAQRYARDVRDDLESLYFSVWTVEEQDERERRGEPCGLCDWLADFLDVEYEIDSNGELLGVKLYVTLGGPSCWVDTRRQCVEARWGGESGWADLDARICDELNEIMAEDLAALMDARSTGRGW